MRAVLTFGAALLFALCLGHRTAAAATLYVDDNDPTCGGNAPCFTTIQSAINAASAGDTISVAAGTYAEQIDVNKALTLSGPNANINPNTGTRVAEAIIIPTASNPLDPAFGGPIVVYLSASGVTFRGFTVDGDNPSLTSGVVYNGSDVDAEFGIYGDGSANLNAVVEHNIAQNIGEISIWLNTFGIGGARNPDSRIQANKVDNCLGNFGQALRISDDAWANVIDNVVTRSRVGITIENFSGNVTAHPASVIARNNITAFRIGIRHNLHYVYAAPGFTIRDNTVQSYVQTPLPPQVNGATAWQGIRVESIQQTVPVAVANNSVNGNRAALAAAGYTRVDGLNVTNSSATSPNIRFTTNTVTDSLRGLFHETTAVPTLNCNTFTNNAAGVVVDAAATNGLVANRNNIAGNTAGLQNNGPATVNAQSNWWGAADGPGPVGPGSGDTVSVNVDFSNWLMSPANCSCAPPLIISELRLGGPGGDDDEFVEIYNNGNSEVSVYACDGSSGYAVVSGSDGVARFTVPNGIAIPARGHYLGVNSLGYSLASYPAGGPGSSQPTATGDATYTTGIPLLSGIALFNTANPVNFNGTNRLDAVGFTSEPNPLYREGAGLQPLAALLTDHSLVRKLPGGCHGFSGGVNDDCNTPADVQNRPAPTSSYPVDTDNNASDFLLVDIFAIANGGQRRLGAPGPENLSSPVANNGRQIVVQNFDPNASATGAPNRVRNTGATGANATYGTLEIRKSFFNSTGSPITRLRFRVTDITTLPAPASVAPASCSGSTCVADMRELTSGPLIGVATSSGPRDLAGTTLETPPGQPLGGGWNSSMSADTITLAQPLMPGQGINLRFLLGVEQNGKFRFFITVEALPFK